MSRLIYLIGPSGAGKDSLLDAIRASSPQGLLVAHRYITRPAGLPGENHVSLTVDEFQLRRRSGLFALYWQAHHYRYAVGIEVDLWLERGMDVVVNGSRAHLKQAKQYYGSQLFPICLAVSPAILRHRLLARGRENADQIEERLRRADEQQHNLPSDCALLQNDGPLQQTLAQFWQLLSRTERKENV
ncbi:ribose 1,5-bisphosphokinase [Lonsdalea populi]|uniref:Ribose 1,5-bisphosphate phosphokinase PhnN n=1 Tax=Lonsdalea populi TaxID=1172565 RepID=A0A3N0UGM5_9GAMM|nr:ribose 1,5-bisphosphokinase [Lonsdalea populi]OSM97414.1 ribose-phosphate pyrophosphokinase [Lonsdalea populi]RAT73014.1 ribose-phosphate pyrophosphokinase [Lonsdalea populi]RAT74238.1 ribose-phosphate pyrophosphokinase [Lonsdalea populi]RAT76633.1 ribose-phosphate pyrophosphokinase [Lonsdalea populi]RAT77692.1 ribose-phosphate pyrophosphokinase [Lonsdalea populi]